MSKESRFGIYLFDFKFDGENVYPVEGGDGFNSSFVGYMYAKNGSHPRVLNQLVTSKVPKARVFYEHHRNYPYPFDFYGQVPCKPAMQTSLSQLSHIRRPIIDNQCERVIYAGSDSISSSALSLQYQNVMRMYGLNVLWSNTNTVAFNGTCSGLWWKK